ncbi:GNAT family N-acetyltransferase [Heyndrickxia sp. MSNUG]|uniref:GNAT family N-acetyltransferase n=1 Tax=Heyndrickxia sp. MSNUG TaxID=3136677 RepID=UPI003C2F62D4
MEKIKELTNQEQLLEAYPVMKQLRTDMTEEMYVELLTQMKKEGYQLFALYDEEKIVSLAGLSWRTNFYNKKHIYIYDLITDASGRSRGYGERLLKFIHDWGKENGAEFVALESGIQRKDAHRFYEEKLNYDKWCYSFRKTL